MTTNHITSVRIKSLPVLDQDEALDFYSTHLGFEVRDAGVEISQEPVEQPYGTDFGIRDPFGNHVRINQPASA